jgi:hypothetical protein
MKIATWQIDLKSLVIGVLLAAVAFLLFAGTSSQAQSETLNIYVGDGGVYIVKGERVYWRSKAQCSEYPGCHP